MARRSLLLTCFVGVVACLVSALVLFDPPGAAGSVARARRTKIVDGKPNQWLGVQSGPFVGWSQGPFLHRERNVAIVRGDGRRVTIRPHGAGALLSDIYGNKAIYARWTDRNSDIKFFDLDTKKTSSPPKGVNTGDLEESATRSGNLLLFWRVHFKRKYRDYLHAREEVILFNLRTHKKRLLVDANTSRNHFAVPGQVNGRWVDWYECHDRPCVVRRMNLDTHKISTTHLSRPVSYAPSITAAGTAFFAASGYTCGTTVRLYRWPLGGKPRVIYKERKGFDTISTYGSTTPDGAEHVVFEVMSCKTERADVYRMDFGGVEPSKSPSSSPSSSASPDDCGLPVCPSLSPVLLGRRRAEGVAQITE